MTTDRRNRYQPIIEKLKDCLLKAEARRHECQERYPNHQDFEFVEKSIQYYKNHIKMWQDRSDSEEGVI